MAQSESTLTASVIVYVPKRARDIAATLRSLDAQTIDHADIEAIFVGAGTKAKELKGFVKERPWAKVADTKETHAFAARNAGIDTASGAYLFFLDAGDELSENALSKVVAFFDKHRDEVDVVTYKLLECKGEEQNLVHYRYKTMTASGIYNLLEPNNYYLCQTDINICVRNRPEDPIHFALSACDEDCVAGVTQYVAAALMRRGAMGFCAGASYLRMNSDVDPYAAQAVFSFDDTVRMYEGLFGPAEQEVPGYVQALLVDELVRRVRQGTALPVHLDGTAHEQAMARLENLLGRVSNEVLFSHPTASIYHRLYIRKMGRAQDVRVLAGPGGVSVVDEHSALWSAKKIEVFLMRTRSTGDTFVVNGAVRSPLLAYDTNCDVHLYLRTTEGASVKIRELELADSAESYCGSPYKVANFLSFMCALPLDKVADFTFVARVNGRDLPVNLVCKRPYVTFGVPLLNTMVCGDKMVVLRAAQATISVGERTKELYNAHKENLRRNLDKRVRLVRAAVDRLSAYLHGTYEEVWIYTDAPGRLDNAWYQYLHDAGANDGVMRYYVANGVQVDDEEAPQGKACRVIQYGSWMHRIMHWVADRRLASDISPVCLSPWDSAARTFYCDFDNAEIVYLQHGVLWAHLPWYYAHDKVLVDRVVVSTQFEIDNLTANYGFSESDLIPSGMARYDLIEHVQPAEKKILLCPSWRSYLVGELGKEGRVPLDAKFRASDYFKGLDALLKSPRLAEVLERYDYALDLKLHPNFACYAPLFKGLEGRVHLVEQVEHEHAYAAIVTDYSSYSFDFAYLNRAIIYYIPDEEQFRAGVSNYRELDMDLDDALGEHVRSAEEVVDAIGRILAQGGVPYGRYGEKERSFFLHYDNEQRARTLKALRG